MPSSSSSIRPLLRLPTSPPFTTHLLAFPPPRRSQPPVHRPPSKTSPFTRANSRRLVTSSCDKDAYDIAGIGVDVFASVLDPRDEDHYYFLSWSFLKSPLVDDGLQNGAAVREALSVDDLLDFSNAEEENDVEEEEELDEKLLPKNTGNNENDVGLVDVSYGGKDKFDSIPEDDVGSLDWLSHFLLFICLLLVIMLLCFFRCFCLDQGCSDPNSFRILMSVRCVWVENLASTDLRRSCHSAELTLSCPLDLCVLSLIAEFCFGRTPPRSMTFVSIRSPFAPFLCHLAPVGPVSISVWYVYAIFVYAVIFCLI